MDTLEKDQRRQEVLKSLRVGTLPREAPIKVWAGNGTGRPCFVCACTLTPRDVEYELEFETRQAVVLDRHCHAVWEQERTKA
jgi:mRNA-degrading endonuclease toxin of MazEF toxin-antitoxin module